MDLIDRLRELSTKIGKVADQLQTEEATKTALVMPFINALGYNVFDPMEVVPEFTADVGTKKGEKVDYVIMRDGKPIILIEAKPVTANLDNVHCSQLYRYFSVTDARFGVLTNGIHYRFFSDLESPNKMDSRPFLEIDMRSLTEGIVDELKKFAKETFDLDNILSTASELKYTKGMKVVLADEFANPSEELVRMLTGRVYSGRMTQAVRDQFGELVKKACAEFINDRVKMRLQSAIDREPVTVPAETAAEKTGRTSADDKEKLVETTLEELEAYHIVKSIVRSVVASDRVIMRDTQSYCGVLLDDNNRKPICRLFFNQSQRYIGLFDAEKNCTRFPIASLDEIYNYAEQLCATVKQYGKPQPATSGQAEV